MTEKKPGVALVVSAPSGAGKSVIIKRVRELEPGLGFSVSCTTRSPREGEQDGVHYYFLSREAFNEKVSAGEFIEHAEFSGNCYGTLRSEVEDRLKNGQDVIIEIEVQGAKQIKDSATEGLLSECVHFLFIKPPSLEVLEQRLRGRGTDSEESIAKRLNAASFELAQSEWYDDVIINDIVEDAARDFIAVLSKKRAELAGA